MRTSFGPNFGSWLLLHPDARLGFGLDQRLHEITFISLFPPYANAAIGPVDVLGLVCGRHLRADPRLALGHHRIREADDVDALREHAVGHLRGLSSVADHDRDDGVVAGQQVESQLLHARAETSAVVAQLHAQLVALEQVEHRQRCSSR